MATAHIFGLLQYQRYSNWLILFKRVLIVCLFLSFDGRKYFSYFSMHLPEPDFDYLAVTSCLLTSLVHYKIVLIQLRNIVWFIIGFTIVMVSITKVSIQCHWRDGKNTVVLCFESAIDLKLYCWKHRICNCLLWNQFSIDGSTVQSFHI